MKSFFVVRFMVNTYRVLFLHAKAPKVGRDKVADDWIREKYEESDKSVSLDQFIQDHRGFYVIELAGEPGRSSYVYHNGAGQKCFQGPIDIWLA